MRGWSLCICLGLAVSASVPVSADELCVRDPRVLEASMMGAVDLIENRAAVAIVSIKSPIHLSSMASVITEEFLKAFQKHGIPTVEVDKGTLDVLLERLDFQATGMISPDSAVEIGKWIAAKHLGFGILKEKVPNELVTVTIKIVSLKTRLHILVESFDLSVESCSLQSELINLPDPSPGGRMELPDYDKRN